MIKELTTLDLVRDDLKRWRTRCAASRRRVPLGEAFLELLKSGGKRLRPAVALASYGLYRPAADDRAVALAAAVETLHNATLVHDDLIDGSLLRRGATTINAVWDKGATVLAGDYLFARAAGFAPRRATCAVQLFAKRYASSAKEPAALLERQWLQRRDPITRVSLPRRRRFCRRPVGSYSWRRARAGAV
jgi:geranylgeranyl pyrophosphate synthase